MTSPARTTLDPFFADLRRREFSRLDAVCHAYLDYTGSALYGASQIRAHHAMLERGVFGNPHSNHTFSSASTDAIEAARRRILRFFDVEATTHVVCLTANATAAIKLVAESYPFTPASVCLLSADNHNSVNGIREYARRAGARIRYLPLDDELRLTREDPLLADAAGDPGPGARAGLLAFPAQSNFSGVLHPLSLVTQAQARGLDVLLDAAAFVPSHPLSLGACPADFVALSFYKMFGFPTGVGALVARREALARLRRPWFAGGTIDYVSVQLDTHQLRDTHEAFEDGTPDFLSIAALAPGFALFDEVGLPRISAHVTALTRIFLDGLRAMTHGNGVPLARVYGPHGVDARGGTIAFNVCDRTGRPIRYTTVEARAAEARVSIRSGCFCNPGAAEAAFAIDRDRAAGCLEELSDSFSIPRFGDCLGTPVGAVRVSVGPANNVQDIDRALEVVASFRE